LNAIDTDRHIIPPTSLVNPKAIAAGWAVLLVRSDDRVTRQVYLSLHSATKALDRAKASGREARMVLVELVPTPGVPVTVVGGGQM
jgi:hypothetical protein